jgi:anti-anti-sigma regulatory factor
MPVHVQVYHRSERVLIEIDSELNADAVGHCLAAYDRGQISGWKEITVVLRNLQRIDASGIELLLYLRELARGCRLRVFDCDPAVEPLLAAAGLRAEGARAAAAPKRRARKTRADEDYAETALSLG